MSQPQPTSAPAASTGEPPRRDPLVWVAVVLVAVVLVGGLVYVGYRHPALIEPVGLGLTAVGVLVPVVKWAATHRR
ncbi:hypothetical protein EDE04_0019 [Streptomyces sp. 2132.2]|uniref:hypothetical protein n=1 Tax=Streptomyces sp. 2132.2 TaxID=2485161 RepID=UPI000FB364B7|nr:hypothetical protein [Streptomyces sp. 2132.2]ROQ93635.1 hypothetical protein EDE04_0019 [Streptomyces sp. 2132.2]